MDDVHGTEAPCSHIRVRGKQRHLYSKILIGEAECIRKRFIPRLGKRLVLDLETVRFFPYVKFCFEIQQSVNGMYA